MESLQEFFRRQPTKRFDRQETIIQQGDIPQCAFSIRTGYVKGYDITAQGQEQMVWFGGPGDIFPMGYLMSVTPYTQFFYGAFSDCELHILHRDDTMQFLKGNNAALLELTSSLTLRFYDMLKRVRALEQPKASDKIAHTIYFLTERFAGQHLSDRTEIPLPLTHQDIANLLGLTRETVAVELKHLKDAKLVYYDKWHFIVYAKAMREHLGLED